jgi:hypothetical protein
MVAGANGGNLGTTVALSADGNTRSRECRATAIARGSVGVPLAPFKKTAQNFANTLVAHSTPDEPLPGGHESGT